MSIQQPAAKQEASNVYSMPRHYLANHFALTANNKQFSGFPQQNQPIAAATDRSCETAKQIKLNCRKNTFSVPNLSENTTHAA
jgi:hypothetical protein